jgi:hypothetical protein
MYNGKYLQIYPLFSKTDKIIIKCVFQLSFSAMLVIFKIVAFKTHVSKLSEETSPRSQNKNGDDPFK